MQNPGDWNGRGLYKSCPKHPLWNTHWTTQWASIKYCIMILFSHHHYHYHHHHHHHHQTPMIFPQWSWRWRTKPNLAQNWSSTTPQDPPSGELGWGKVLKTFKESSESINQRLSGNLNTLPNTAFLTAWPCWRSSPTTYTPMQVVDKFVINETMLML